MKQNKLNRLYDPIRRSVRNWKNTPEALRHDILFQKSVLQLKPGVFKYFEDTIKTKYISMYAIKYNYLNFQYIKRSYLEDFDFVSSVISINRKCFCLLPYNTTLFTRLIANDISLISELVYSEETKKLVLMLLKDNVIPPRSFSLINREFSTDLSFSLYVFEQYNQINFHTSCLLSLKKNKGYLCKFMAIHPRVIHWTTISKNEEFILDFMSKYSKYNYEKYAFLYKYISPQLQKDRIFIEKLSELNPYVIKHLKRSKITHTIVKNYFDHFDNVNGIQIPSRFLETMVHNDLSLRNLEIYLSLVPMILWKLKYVLFYIRNASPQDIEKRRREITMYSKIKPSLKRNKGLLLQDNNDCSICLGTIKDAVILLDHTKNTCAHMFCKNCITKCKSKVCPICRKDYIVTKHV